MQYQIHLNFWSADSKSFRDCEKQNWNRLDEDRVCAATVCGLYNKTTRHSTETWEDNTSFQKQPVTEG